MPICPTYNQKKVPSGVKEVENLNAQNPQRATARLKRNHILWIDFFPLRMVKMLNEVELMKVAKPHQAKKFIRDGFLA